MIDWVANLGNRYGVNPDTIFYRGRLTGTLAGIVSVVTPYIVNPHLHKWCQDEEWAHSSLMQRTICPLQPYGDTPRTLVLIGGVLCMYVGLMSGFVSARMRELRTVDADSLR